MRDGKWIATRPAKELSTDEIIHLMVDRPMENRFPPKDNEPGAVLLECSNITGKYMPTCQDVSFDLREGEIMGVAGLVGSRRTELLNTIFGTMTIASGEMKLRGKVIHNKNSQEATANGFALITEERRATGLFPEASILFNSVIANVTSYVKHGLLSSRNMGKDTAWVIESMKVKTPSQKTYIKYLSGGNQQKVIIGRWLLTKPDILLLDEPTRGIDVGAKAEIQRLMIEMCEGGVSVIFISSEMEEVIRCSNRIVIMRDGQKAAELEGPFDGNTQSRILSIIAGEEVSA